VADRWFSPGIPVSSTNKTDHQDITEILLKVALNTINITTTIQLKSGSLRGLSLLRGIVHLKSAQIRGVISLEVKI
jgi:hypothetical protein